MATIATHNGSAVSRAHNLRDNRVAMKRNNIDPDGIHENWLDVDPRKMYDDLFGEAVRRYNEKQQRADRKVLDYYAQVATSKTQHPVYEMIVGVYPKDGEDITQEMQRQILKEYIDGWQERNPNLMLCGVYYHADEPEAQPHLHIDYIPVAHGYKRGMEVQAGLNRAYEEMGYDGKSYKETPQIRWERAENEYLDKLCISHGIEVEHPMRGQENVQHYDTATYKAKMTYDHLQEAIEQSNRQIQQAQVQKEHLEKEAVKLQKDNASLKAQNRLEKMNTMKNPKIIKKSILGQNVTISRDDFEAAERAIKQNRESKKLQEEAEKEKIAAEAMKHEAEQRNRYLQDTIQNINQRIREAGQEYAKDRVQEMEKYMDSLTMKDGRTVLAHFEEKYQKKMDMLLKQTLDDLHKPTYHHSHGWER